MHITINNKKYLIEKVLGEGSFGIVYKAENENGETVAIKKINLNKFVILEKNLLEAFKNDCDIIICYKDFGQDEKFAYIVMEYIDGTPINSSHLKKLGIPKLFSVLINILVKLCAKDIYHLDIKPDNILFDNRTNNIKLGDFGLACEKLYDKNTKSACGTPGFTAPEVLKDAKFSCKADVFSMCCTIYTLMFGEKVYDNWHSFYKEPSKFLEKAKEKIYSYNVEHFDYMMILADMLNIDDESRPTPNDLLARIGRVKVNENDKAPIKNNLKLVDFIAQELEEFVEDDFETKEVFINAIIFSYKSTRGIKNNISEDIKTQIEKKYNITIYE